MTTRESNTDRMRSFVEQIQQQGRLDLLDEFVHPDFHCVGDGDLVATHKVFRGRHTGPWFGVPPSGNPVEFRVMDLVRFQDGQLIEHWAVADAVRLLRQTGALTPQ